MLTRYHEEVREWFSTPIEVLPAVDVLGQQAVRLLSGEYDAVVARADDPAVLVGRFAAAGARCIHLVDLDGARSGHIRLDLVRRLVEAAGSAEVQASGGIRNPGDARALLDAGASRVVVGTAAFPNPGRWVDAVGARLTVALDVRDGRVRSAGWTKVSLELDDAVERCLDGGVPRVLCTAIARDGTLSGPDLDLVAAVAASGLGVLAAGGIRSPADVVALAAAGADAAVVGRALFSTSAPAR